MAAYRRVDDNVTCGLTACTPGSAPDPTLGIEYEKAFTFTFYHSTTPTRGCKGQNISRKRKHNRRKTIHQASNIGSVKKNRDQQWKGNYLKYKKPSSFKKFMMIIKHFSTTNNTISKRKQEIANKITAIKCRLEKWRHMFEICWVHLLALISTKCE